MRIQDRILDIKNNACCYTINDTDLTCQSILKKETANTATCACTSSPKGTEARNETSVKMTLPPADAPTEHS